MKMGTFMTVIGAAHHGKLVQGEYSSRGGIMLVAPPEHMKTTIIQSALNPFREDALIVGDLTTREMSLIKNEVSSNRYSTLALPEFQKIYERDSRVAANLEGSLRAMMEEGFAYISGSSPAMQTSNARALVVLGVTDSCYEENFGRWAKSGFIRRMLVCRYKLSQPHKLAKAVSDWKKIELNFEMGWRVPIEISIPHSVTKKESENIRKMCAFQVGNVLPAMLLHQIVSVLRWKARTRKEKDLSWNYIKDFSQALDAKSAEVDL